jgi:tetratricopeptide (TPR) repeat protein
VFKMMLAIVEKAQGPRHPNAGIALNNLAGVYEAQGRHAEADAMRKRALDVTDTLFRGQPYVPYQGAPPAPAAPVQPPPPRKREIR